MRKDDACVEDINNAATRLAEYLAGNSLDQAAVGRDKDR